MFFEPVLERFARHCPLPLLFRASIEYALAPEALDDLFQRTATRQFTGQILFSSLAEMLGQAVCRIRPSVHAAYQALPHPPASAQAVYQKLAGVEPAVSAALVRHTAHRLQPVLDQLGGCPDPWLPGHPVRVLDGTYLGRTEHRIKALRGTRAAAKPGLAVVVLDPETRLVRDAFLSENGHAQERSLIPEVLATVQAGEVWVADRNFTTIGMVAGLKARGARFVLRENRSTLSYEAVTPLRPCGRAETGWLEEQWVKLTNVPEKPKVRRIVLHLDQPTEEGDTELVLLTDLTKKEASAAKVAWVYRHRWDIEGLFGHLAQALSCEVATLAYPGAALLGFALGLVANNLLAVVQGALGAVHGAARVSEELSYYYVAEEMSATYRGMMVALPAEAWVGLRGLSAGELAAVLREWASGVRLAAYRKHPRGPKKPKPSPPSCGRKKHVATAKVLAADPTRRKGNPYRRAG